MLVLLYRKLQVNNGCLTDVSKKDLWVYTYIPLVVASHLLAIVRQLAKKLGYWLTITAHIKTSNFIGCEHCILCDVLQHVFWFCY